MKVFVQSEQPKPKPFPKLMIYDNFIVWFTSDNNGVVVVPANSDYNQFEKYSGSSSQFVDFVGKIEFTQVLNIKVSDFFEDK